MLYQLKITRSAVKDIRRLPPDIQRRIREAIQALGDDPRPAGGKKLVGRDDYSIRVGDYRVIYEIDDDAQVVTIWRAGRRGGVYRGLLSSKTRTPTAL